MDPTQVLIKTDKGREEVETRVHKLDFRRRATLIMVDGQASFGELLPKAANLGDANAFLTSLMEEGFITAVAGATTSAAPATGGKEDAAALNAVKMAAARYLTDILGPTAEDFAMRLEKCKLRGEFMEQAERCRNVLNKTLGAKKADEFWRIVTTMLG